jgi:hypothetical protein
LVARGPDRAYAMPNRHHHIERSLIMRYTSTLVETVAREVKELTDGAFAYGYSDNDLGYGARYVDGVRQLVWLGKTGAQEAAAYYAFGALAWESGKRDEIAPTLPDTVAAVVGDMRQRADSGHLTPKVAEARDQGTNDGRFRWADARRS